MRALSRELARHELTLSQLVLRFHRADGWRRLGYATEAQYARERLGMSRSSVKAKRALAARLDELPLVAEALGTAELGVEAALQLVRVVTSSTQAAWVERARQRTIKHLQEEVAATLTAVRLSGEASCPPPEESEMEAFHELERAVVSGQACRAGATGYGKTDRGKTDRGTIRSEAINGAAQSGSARRPWRVMLFSLARWLEAGVQLSAEARQTPLPSAARRVLCAGRVVLRLRMSRALYAWWRGLEAQARSWLPPGASWLRFLCLSVWRAWRHMLGGDVAYGQIYIRDRYRCTSPVCSRKDVTPHHLELRSAGGSDEDDNVAAVCTWCHLFGVHGGRIRATGTARRIRWELGTRERPCLVVNGRQRYASRPT